MPVNHIYNFSHMLVVSSEYMVPPKIIQVQITSFSSNMLCFRCPAAKQLIFLINGSKVTNNEAHFSIINLSFRSGEKQTKSDGFIFLTCLASNARYVLLPSKSRVLFWLNYAFRIVIKEYKIFMAQFRFDFEGDFQLLDCHVVCIGISLKKIGRKS